MRAKPLTVMSIVVNHNRICFVFLIEKQPMDWEMSYVAAKSPEHSRDKVLQWIKHYSVDVVITEATEGTSRKGAWTHKLLLGVQEAAQTSDAQHIEAVPQQPFQSKYEQIDDLCARYPQMIPYAPRKRLYWENEPHTVSYFQALAMAEQVLTT